MESEGARKSGCESGARERVQEWRERKGQEWIERGESGAREGTSGLKEKGTRGGEKEMGREWSERESGER